MRVRDGGDLAPFADPAGPADVRQDQVHGALRQPLLELPASALGLPRRDLTDPDEVAYYLVYAPTGTPLAEIVRAVGARWTIEDLFKLAKRQVGLDQYEVRSWTGRHRHTTLALVALAALVPGAAKEGRSARSRPRPRLHPRAASPHDASAP